MSRFFVGPSSEPARSFLAASLKQLSVIDQTYSVTVTVCQFTMIRPII